MNKKLKYNEIDQFEKYKFRRQRSLIKKLTRKEISSTTKVHINLDGKYF
jgi:hypothetical protein